jgi:hypothetical protein
LAVNQDKPSKLGKKKDSAPLSRTGLPWQHNFTPSQIEIAEPNDFLESQFLRG